ncbi:MAG: VOC family protein [Desulfobacterales bacterium]
MQSNEKNSALGCELAQREIIAAKAIRHTGIVVSDMSKSVLFYRDLLGLKVWADFVDDSKTIQTITGVSGAKVRMVKLKAADGVSIELLQYLSHPQEPQAHPAFRIGCNHIGIQLDDIDAFYKDAKAQGVHFHSPPVISADGVGKMTYCRDPDGNIVEFVQLFKAIEGDPKSR